MNKDILRQAGLGKFVDLVENGQCPTCEKRITQEMADKMSYVSKKELEISGMCQECQDGEFNEEFVEPHDNLGIGGPPDE
jgi:hypothetical protein